MAQLQVASNATVSAGFVAVSLAMFSRFRLHAASCGQVMPNELPSLPLMRWISTAPRPQGYLGGFVTRGKPYPASMLKPDIVGQSLTEVAHKFVELG